MDRDTKQAEKDYLRRSESTAWERVKPFSPAATDTVDESLRLIHDFAVAAHGADVRLGQRILDLGAGAGWTSEWLRRLNLEVVTVDISHAMLRVASHRLQGRGLVAGDLETLPFRDGVFDRALCLNALHHVPDPVAALREVYRVLNARGRLVLVEPGSGHAERATSRVAVQEFGVLEQDLEAGDLMRFCVDAGFPRVHVRPLSYMSGEIELSLEELGRWRRWSRTKRPLRVLTKLGRAALEAFGLQKQNLLFEEAFSIGLSRVLARHVSEQAVVVASKPGYREGIAHYAGGMRLRKAAELTSTGRLSCRVALRNTGAGTWRAHATVGKVQLGVQLLDAAATVIDRDYWRIPLPDDVEPGGECELGVEFPLPGMEAATHFRLDAVAEGITWLQLDGSAPCSLQRQPT